MLLYRNNLATITALKGKSYLPVQKINMFVNIGIKVRGLVAEAYRLFSARNRNFKIGQNSCEKYISEKKSSPLFGAENRKTPL